MTLGLAIFKSQVEEQHEGYRPSTGRRLTEVSEFDVDAYLYSDVEPTRPERSRWSADSEDRSLRIPSLRHYSASSDGSHPATPEDASFPRHAPQHPSSQALQPSLPLYGVPLDAGEAKRLDGGTRSSLLKTPLTTITSRIATPRSTAATPSLAAPSPALIAPTSKQLKRKPSTISLQALGKSLRRSFSLGRNSSATASPKSPSMMSWRSRRSTDTRLSPTVATMPIAGIEAKDRAHAVVARAARTRSVSAPKRPAPSPSTPPPLPSSSSIAQSFTPLLGPRPLSQPVRPRTAPPMSDQSKLLPPLPLGATSAGPMPPRPFLSSARLPSSAFINPWTSPKLPASRNDAEPRSPCDATSSMPLLDRCAKERTEAEEVREAARRPLVALDHLSPSSQQRKVSFSRRNSASRRQRGPPPSASLTRTHRASSFDTPLDLRRRASSFSLGGSRRGSELVWMGVPDGDMRSAHSSPFAFPTTPQAEEEEDSTMLGGIVRSDGTGHYFFLRDPWTGNALETAGVPPVPPVEEIEAVLMRERRGTRASSLPTSVSSLDVKVSRGPGVKVAAVSSAGLRVSIDVGTRAF